MSAYHLHARLFEGSLCQPIRDELRTAESDDYAIVLGLAEELSGDGFRVWLYDHGSVVRTTNGEGGYRVIGEWRPASEVGIAEERALTASRAGRGSPRRGR